MLIDPSFLHVPLTVDYRARIRKVTNFDRTNSAVAQYVFYYDSNIFDSPLSLIMIVVTKAGINRQRLV